MCVGSILALALAHPVFPGVPGQQEERTWGAEPGVRH